MGREQQAAFQRGAEHERNIKAGKIVHPMVQYFWEQHRGVRQQVLMRVVLKHLIALDRQVRERINIENSSRNEEEYLNLKNVWAGSRYWG